MALPRVSRQRQKITVLYCYSHHTGCVLTWFYLFVRKIWHLSLASGLWEEAEANQYTLLHWMYNSIVWGEVMEYFWNPLSILHPIQKQTKNNCSFRSLAPLPDTPSHFVASLSVVLRPVLKAWHNRWCMFLIGQIYLTYPSVKEPIKTWRNGGRPKKTKNKLLCRVMALP